MLLLMCRAFFILKLPYPEMPGWSMVDQEPNGRAGSKCKNNCQQQITDFLDFPDILHLPLKTQGLFQNIPETDALQNMEVGPCLEDCQNRLPSQHMPLH